MTWRSAMKDMEVIELVLVILRVVIEIIQR